jgi:hypothetical protein
MNWADTWETHTLPFLACLTDDHAHSVRVHWQTFDDRDSKTLKAWGRYAGFNEISGQLQRANETGAGIYITVNETDGEGRKIENIAGIRAYWADLDGVEVDTASLPIPPSMVVQSRAGKHLYWLSYGDITREDHRKMQLRIAHGLGSDPSVIDPSRVLRVPGFFHNKAEPFMVTLLEAHPHRRYWFNEMRGAF